MCLACLIRTERLHSRQNNIARRQLFQQKLARWPHRPFQFTAVLHQHPLDRPHQSSVRFLRQRQTCLVIATLGAKESEPTWIGELREGAALLI
jgi:hypothetical protein